MKDFHDRLGKPDVKVAGLCIWIHGRQFQEAQDYWDGNWLNMTAHCAARGADVGCGGSTIHLSEISSFLSELEKLYQTLEGKAQLPCLEPELSVELTAESLGGIEMVVHITPDHLSQQHTFTFPIDQSYLPGLISDCKRVLDQYPIRGKP
jgi:hypothetical protein